MLLTLVLQEQGTLVHSELLEVPARTTMKCHVLQTLTFSNPHQYGEKRFHKRWWCWVGIEQRAEASVNNRKRASSLPIDHQGAPPPARDSKFPHFLAPDINGSGFIGVVAATNPRTWQGFQTSQLLGLNEKYSTAKIWKFIFTNFFLKIGFFELLFFYIFINIFSFRQHIWACSTSFFAYKCQGFTEFEPVLINQKLNL